MKAASYIAFIIYAVSFCLGFYIQFLAGDFFEITRSLGYGFILMIFSGKVFISTHNLKFAYAVEMGAAPEDASFLERSRNLMVAIFLTEWI